MDKKEILYELSLKYNTLKMYENTIEQMRKNNCSDDAINVIIGERDSVEAEVSDLLSYNDLDKPGHPEKSPHVGSDNKFLTELNKHCEYRNLYDERDGNFFDNISKKAYEAPTIEVKHSSFKPTFAYIQEKISNSQWISCSNFIVKFPKEKIDIDEWRVSGVNYSIAPKVTSATKYICPSHNVLTVIVNDFAELRDSGEYVVLSDIVEKLYSNGVSVIGNIDVDVINNNGVLLYTLRFVNCIYDNCEFDGFSYESTDLRHAILNFSYDEIKIIKSIPLT